MRRLILPLILLIAFLLRIILLGQIPAGFTPDEASFGYDAYSILKTGRDQWGRTLPILFESFGDFKSPAYGYLSIIPVALFGLNKFAVRLPNALLGTLTVLVLYFLVKEFFKDRKRLDDSDFVALWASFLLSVSPWHIALSRGAFESNLTTFFIPLGILLFLKGLEKNKFIYWSSIVFGINMFTYHSAKFVTPLVVLFLVLIYRKNILKINKKILLTGLLFFVFFIALTAYSFKIGAGRRALDINIYNGSLVQAFDERTRLTNAGYNKYIAHLVYNKYTITINRFYKNYTSYFSPRFLFTKGPAESTYGMVQGIGVLFWVESVFLALFIYSTLRFKNKVNIFILFWILISPIPAALSAGVGFAANRVAIMMPAIQIASAIGAYYAFLLRPLKNSKFRLYLNLIAVGVVIVGTGVFVSKYFISDKSVMEKQMLFGNLESMNYLNQNFNDKNILVSTTLSEPHIYWAFESLVDPKIFQNETKLWDYKERNLSFLDQMPEYKIGNLTFKHIDWKKDPKKFDVILGRPDDFPKGVVVKKVFYYSDSTAALYLVENNSQSYAKAD